MGTRQASNLLHDDSAPWRARRLVGVLQIPAAARMTCWLNAWLDARASADDVVGGLGADGGADFRLNPGDQPVSAALLLGELRRRGVTQASAALPLSGHPLGLGGPAAFNHDAIEVGEAVLLHGTGLGLLPARLGRPTRWRALPAEPPPYAPDVSTADRGLREALREATERLVALDVASWNPDIADALIDLRSTDHLEATLPFASPRAASTMLGGLRAASIAQLAEQDDSGPISADETARRHAALRPLRVAARAAIAAAASMRAGMVRD